MEEFKAVKITVLSEGVKKVLLSKERKSLMELLQENDIRFQAACGGAGRCGKCKIKVIEGHADITPEDAIVFSKEELEAGERLSCRVFPKEDITIEVEDSKEDSFAIVTHYETEGAMQEEMEEENYSIGIDIGTTTIAFQLLGGTSNRVLETYTTINRQRDYGADVISRMNASNQGKKEELKRSIREDLKKGIFELIKQRKIKLESLSSVCIGCNTTMSHLLMGYSCETLGVHPFKPVNIDFIHTTLEELEIKGFDTKVLIFPGISTFVGGDIVAGLYALDFMKLEEVSMLIDLGTNGEMVIGNKEFLLCTSTAAGPAFEGGNISCGTGSIQGAISNVTIGEKKEAEITTIGNKSPVGICGTGVIEVTSELVRAHLVDETGLLEEDYFEEGYVLAQDRNGKNISFTQEDVREIQLAKAAVRSGIEVLIHRFGTDYAGIKNIYLAGGFGYHIDVEKAFYLGLIPREFSGKIKTVGNSSLSGAVKYLSKKGDGEGEIKEILTKVKEISLSADPEFNDLYMEHMMFEEE